MKKNGINTLRFHLKGYDKVRAIHKLRQSINKFGDKLGKKNNILNNILTKNFISKKFIDLNIARYYPKTKPIKFSNDLIRMKHDDYTKDNNGDKIAVDEATKNVIESPLNIIEKEIKNVNLNNSEGKIGNNYFSKAKNAKKIIDYNNNKRTNNNNNKFENNIIKYYKRKDKELKSIEITKRNINSNEIDEKFLSYLRNISKFHKLFQPIMKNRVNNEYLSSSIDNNNINNNKISSRNNNKNIGIINYYHNKDNLLEQKPLSNKNKNKNNTLLYRKKIIPKIKLVKLISNENFKNLQKNYSTLSVGRISNLKIKSRNFFGKRYNTKMKMIKLMHRNVIDETNKDMNGNLVKNNSESINEKYVNKGINTSISQQYNNYIRKRIPSYIRLPNIKRISFPKEDTDLGINDNINNSNSNGSFDYYMLIKDVRNKFINKNYSNDSLVPIKYN